MSCLWMIKYSVLKHIQPPPVIVSNIAEHPSTEAFSLELSSVYLVFAVPGLNRYFLPSLAATGDREPVLTNIWEVGLN